MTPLPESQKMSTYDPERFSIEVRRATEDECALTDDMANVTDGAAAILVDGTLVAVTNEYGTCIPIISAAKSHLIGESVEQLVIHATDLYTHVLELES